MKYQAASESGIGKLLQEILILDRRSLSKIVANRTSMPVIDMIVTETRIGISGNRFTLPLYEKVDEDQFYCRIRTKEVPMKSNSLLRIRTNSQCEQHD